MTKFKIISLPDFEGKTLKEVKEYLNKTYPGQLAGEEDQEEFYERAVLLGSPTPNPKPISLEKIPTVLTLNIKGKTEELILRSDVEEIIKQNK